MSIFSTMIYVNKIQLSFTKTAYTSFMSIFSMMMYANETLTFY